MNGKNYQNPLSTYNLFQLRDGHVVIVIATRSGWAVGGRVRGGHRRGGGARCGTVSAATAGRLVAGRSGWWHRTGQSGAVLGVAIRRKTRGEAQRLRPLGQTANHIVYLNLLTFLLMLLLLKLIQECFNGQVEVRSLNVSCLFVFLFSTVHVFIGTASQWSPTISRLCEIRTAHAHRLSKYIFNFKL